MNKKYIETWEVTNDKSVYVYITDNKIKYVFNDKCLYYSIFENISDLMDYILEGKIKNRVNLNESDFNKWERE